MGLIDLKITEFIETLASDSPAPGGGSASALAASVGSSLAIMVCELTIGKKKYIDNEECIQQVKKDMIELNQLFLSTIDRDTEAFNGVSAVFSMPKETDEDKKKRKEAMQEALQQATIVPFELMEYSVKALETTSKAVGKSNVNAASDLGVAALNLKAGLQGAWLNVLINLDGIKDSNFVATYKDKGSKLLEQGCVMADEIYRQIEGSLNV